MGIKFIQRKSAVKIAENKGSIINATNITDKTINAYSASVIDSKLNTQSINITWKSIVSKVQKNDAYVSNNICHINAFITCSSVFETNTWNILGYIEEKYRPKTALWFPATVMETEYNVPEAMFVRIASDGSINVYTETANKALVVFSCQWRI